MLAITVVVNFDIPCSLFNEYIIGVETVFESFLLHELNETEKFTCKVMH